MFRVALTVLLAVLAACNEATRSSEGPVVAGDVPPAAAAPSLDSMLARFSELVTAKRIDSRCRITDAASSYRLDDAVKKLSAAILAAAPGRGLALLQEADDATREPGRVACRPEGEAVVARALAQAPATLAMAKDATAPKPAPPPARPVPMSVKVRGGLPAPRAEISTTTVPRTKEEIFATLLEMHARLTLAQLVDGKCRMAAEVERAKLARVVPRTAAQIRAMLPAAEAQDSLAGIEMRQRVAAAPMGCAMEARIALIMGGGIADLIEQSGPLASAERTTMKEEGGPKLPELKAWDEAVKASAMNRQCAFFDEGATAALAGEADKQGQLARARLADAQSRRDALEYETALGDSFARAVPEQLCVPEAEVFVRGVLWRTAGGGAGDAPAIASCPRNARCSSASLFASGTLAGSVPSPRVAEAKERSQDKAESQAPAATRQRTLDLTQWDRLLTAWAINQRCFFFEPRANVALAAEAHRHKKAALANVSGLSAEVEIEQHGQRLVTALFAHPIEQLCDDKAEMLVRLALMQTKGTFDTAVIRQPACPREARCALP